MEQGWLVIAVVYFIHSLDVTEGVPAKPCGDEVEWIPDLDDCSTYYICVGGVPDKIVCADGFSFRSDLYVCVPKGSEFDTCVPSPCAQGTTGKIPHPDSCAQYYDCSVASRIDETWEPRLRECRYPYLFNTETRRCERYRNVKCGARYEPKSPCGYYANQCRRAHCRPCFIRHPSCEGLPNGLHAWPGKEGSPDYVGCRQERVLFQRRCPSNNAVQIFHPRWRKCVLYESNLI